MRRILFELALGSASASEEVQFPDETPDAEIYKSFETWKEDYLEYGWEELDDE